MSIRENDGVAGGTARDCREERYTHGLFIEPVEFETLAGRRSRRMRRAGEEAHSCEGLVEDSVCARSDCVRSDVTRSEEGLWRLTYGVRHFGVGYSDKVAVAFDEMTGRGNNGGDGREVAARARRARDNA